MLYDLQTKVTENCGTEDGHVQISFLPVLNLFVPLVALTPKITAFRTVFLSSMVTKRGHLVKHKCRYSLSVPDLAWLTRGVMC